MAGDLWAENCHLTMIYHSDKYTRVPARLCPKLSPGDSKRRGKCCAWPTNSPPN